MLVIEDKGRPAGSLFRGEVIIGQLVINVDAFYKKFLSAGNIQVGAPAIGAQRR